METNIVMKSEKDREIYGVIIKQETKTGFMSLTDLQEAYTHARVLNGWANKGHFQDLLKQSENAERVYYLLKEQGFIKSGFPEFMETIKKEGMVKILKKTGVYKTTGRGEAKTVMCNSYIWLLVAMELNPQLYAKVVIWMTDKLIINRIEAGNFCKALNHELSQLENLDYLAIAKALNVVIFGRHELGIRNTASQEQLKNLYQLEDRIAFAIRKGFVKTQEKIIELIKEEMIIK